MSGRRIETMERDAEIYMEYSRGTTPAAIARKFGVTEATVRTAVKRAIQDQFRLSVEEERAVLADRLNYLTRVFTKMIRKNYVVGMQGKVVIDPATGEPLIDDAPARQAALALLKVIEAQRKMFGTDQPVRHRVEITDKMDEEIERLASDLAAHGAGAPVLPEPALNVSEGRDDDS